jgi:hypothetical protein
VTGREVLPALNVAPSVNVLAAVNVLACTSVLARHQLLAGRGRPAGTRALARPDGAGAQHAAQLAAAGQVHAIS